MDNSETHLKTTQIPPASDVQSTPENAKKCDSKSMWRFLGSIRVAALVVTALTLAGTLIFLAVPIDKSQETVSIILKSYYTVTVAFLIFGYISIIKYNPTSITIYTVFFVLNALVSGFLSIYQLIRNANTISEAYKCKEQFDCPDKTKAVIILCINAVAILYWIGCSAIVIQCYLGFQEKYLYWKSNYAGASGPDSMFQHWCYRNQIESEQFSYNEAIDSLA
ncbi:hypothetical protein BC833DRAFT_618682 [Globomyces pollinis-pini]|nr:hypothetical protein BC833DRAFT_618682 [Globomyces pollinis-pini]